MFDTKKQSGKRNIALCTNFELSQQMTHNIISFRKIKEIKCEVTRIAHIVSIKQVQ